MNNLLLSASIVAPMAIKIALGALVRGTGIIDLETMKKVDKLNFNVLLPVLLFMSIYNAEIKVDSHLKLFSFTVISSLALYFLVILFIPRLIKEPSKSASASQAIVRCNYVIFGLTVASSLYKTQNDGSSALLSAIIVPLSAILAVIILEKNRNGKAKFSTLVWCVVKNPFIITSALGLFFNLCSISLPSFIKESASDIGQTGATLSFLSLGCSLDFNNIRKDLKNIIVATVARLIVTPLLFLPICIWLGFRGQELCALMILFVSPCAISSYSMAVSMDADGPTSANLVVTTTLGSIVTIFFSVLILTNMGYL